MEPVSAFEALIARVSAGPCRFRTALAHLSVFPPGWHNQPRCIDQHVIYLVTKGSGWIDLDPGPTALRHVFRAGDLLWMAPFTCFETGVLDPADAPHIYHMRFRLDIDGELLALDRPFTQLHEAWQWQGICEQWLLAFRRGGRDADVRQQACLLLLASHVRDALATVGGTSGLSQDQRAVVEEYTHRHLPAPITSADLARALGLGRVYFTRLFRLSYGLPPRSWLVQQRLQLAAGLLLETDLEIARIAAELGYHQVPLFCKQFRARFGCSPARYRRGHYSPYGR